LKNTFHQLLSRPLHDASSVYNEQHNPRACFWPKKRIEF